MYGDQGEIMKYYLIVFCITFLSIFLLGCFVFLLREVFFNVRNDICILNISFGKYFTLSTFLYLCKMALFYSVLLSMAIYLEKKL